MVEADDSVPRAESRFQSAQLVVVVDDEEGECWGWLELELRLRL